VLNETKDRVPSHSNVTKQLQPAHDDSDLQNTNRVITRTVYDQAAQHDLKRLRRGLTKSDPRRSGNTWDGFMPI
jgi:hypothetical protein